MKKKVLVLLFAFLVIMICGSSQVFAANQIQFDKEFSGKGSGMGKFGKTLSFAFDADNNIYVSDKENKMIQKLDSEGNFVMQIPESRNDGSPFNSPNDIAVDNQNNIYVADWGSKYIEGTDNPKLYFFSPCVHKITAGKIAQTYFIDEFTPKPKVVTPGTFIVDENGKYGWAIQPKEYNRELLVAIDSKGFLYVLDIKNNFINKYDQSGKSLLSFGKYGSGKGEIDNASDMIVGNENNIIVADKGNNRIVQFDASGNEILTFGIKGQSEGQFIEPIFVIATRNNDIIVKDSSKFERIGLEYPFNSQDEATNEYNIDTTDDKNTQLLEARIQRLEEAIKEGENKDESTKEKLLAKHSRYYTVIERVQVFNSKGEYKNKLIYKIDKNSKELRDLTFLAIDPSGRLYLRDQDRMVIRRYHIGGFLPKFSEMEATYTARAENRSEDFIEDYGDIDQKADLEDIRTDRALKQALLINYDLSEKWNLSMHNQNSIAKQDSTNNTPPKPEDNYDYTNNGWDNDVGMNLKFIANSDPYRYREMNFYSQFLAGASKYQSGAIFTNVNQQNTRREGTSRGVVVGADMDIHPNANVIVEYLRLRPDLTSRNLTTHIYDVSGDLYQVSRSYNSASIIVGEINIKF
jgi:hypothetical protein